MPGNGKYDIEGNGQTLLHVACANYELKKAKKLVKDGVDVNARIINGDSQGATALHMIFMSDILYELGPNPPIFRLTKLLLENGADMNMEYRGCTTLHWICEDNIHLEGFLECFYEDENAFFLEKCLMRCGDLILNSQKDFNVNPVSPRGFSHFHYACLRNNVEKVTEFLDCGVDVNQSIDPAKRYIGGFTPLHFAMAYKSKEVAYLLLTRGADVKAKDVDGNEPLQVAIKRKFVDLPLIETMISHGANMLASNVEGETLLDCLLTYGGLTLESLEYFLSRGCFINIVDMHKGMLGSAMLAAAPNEFLPILERLQQIIDLKGAIKNGYNVIQSIVAVQNKGELTLANYLATIKFLICIGCELDQQDSRGKTALHKATSFGNVAAVDALLQLGADVNVVDYKNKNPFLDRFVRSDFNFLSFRESQFRIGILKKTIANHIWKMRFAGLDVICLNLNDNLVSVTLKQTCQDELTKANKTEIIPKLTVKDFLSDFKAIYAYSKLGFELRNIVDEYFKDYSCLHRLFPEYAGLLIVQYRKACTRRELLQPAGEAIMSIFNVSLPHLVLENILKFFSIRDMESAIAAIKE